jgi:hypothetical protein
MGFSDARVETEIFRKDQAIIIAKNRHLASIGSVRLAYNAAGYEAGRLVARNTTSGLYEKYDDGAGSGLNTAASILFEDVPVGQFASTGDTQLTRGIFAGEVFKSKLVGLDSAAIVDLGGRSYTEADGIEILKF